MSHTFAKNHLHVVFSTKERRKSIPKDIQAELWSYMAGICTNQHMAVIAIGGTDNHSHALFHLPQTLALSKAVQALKANSSKWMNEHGMRFAWQEGYSAFSVSVSNTAAVASYIRNQEDHHRKISFEDEYMALLKKHGIEFDPKYVFGQYAVPPGDSELALDKPMSSLRDLSFIVNVPQHLRAGLNN